MPMAFLIDVTKCIGCRGCQVACKRWNRLEAEQTVCNPARTNPHRLSAKTWTLVEYFYLRRKIAAPAHWRFVKRQCMHCEEPACVSACPVGALRKTAQGPVMYDDARCMGCRYCMLACPFGIPRFEWEKPLPLIRKCTFCADRLEAGRRPACILTCPTGALAAGDRADLIAQAHRRIRDNPGRYVPHVFGEREIGGTSALYLSDVPFEELGFPKALSNEARPSLTWKVLSKLPVGIVGGAVLLAGTWFIARRRRVAGEDRP